MKIQTTRSSMPDFEEYIAMIKPLWESRHLTNMGQYHERLEEMLKGYLEVPNASLMVNGHMALELTIQAMNFPAGSEVITTPFTFVSTTHAIVRNGLQPVFCDVKEGNYTIDESKIEDLITEKTVAILPVHIYGHICSVDKIQEIAYKYGLKVIYDAAHAFGERYKGVGVGNFGNASIFSFHATKVFHTIEGGISCFQERELYETLYNLKNFGIRSEELTVSIGANAKMDEFHAAMGICNLKHIDDEIKKRKRIFEAYHGLLGEEKGICLLPYEKDLVPNYAYCPALLTGSYDRDKVYEVLRAHDVYPRKYFYPLTADMACFKNKYKQQPLEVARECSAKVLCFPIYPDLPLGEVERICHIIKETKNGRQGVAAKTDN
ncbi:aminotransferase [Clostridia bacterium]|nr:aminotransferase [Clostridia bacterium]